MAAGSSWSTPPPSRWSAYPAPRIPLLQRRVLEEQMRYSRQTDPQPWGARPWLGPVLSLAAIIVVGEVLVHAVIGPVTRLPYLERITIGIGFAAGPEIVLLLACVAFARPLAERGGGWRPTFGLDLVRRRDWAAYGIGVGLIVLGNIAIGELSVALTSGRGTQQAQNLSLSHRPGVLQIVVVGVVVVVIAPVVEEFMFRGLLLRSFMRRYGFWPAALMSTALFALFHVYEVTTVLGAVFLAGAIAVLGAVNCYLVRITGRLTPGILVHASFNALALIGLIVQASH